MVNHHGKPPFGENISPPSRKSKNLGNSGCFGKTVSGRMRGFLVEIPGDFSGWDSNA